MKTIIVNAKHEIKVLDGRKIASKLTHDELEKDIAAAILYFGLEYKTSRVDGFVQEMLFDTLEKASRELRERFNKNELSLRGVYDKLELATVEVILNTLIGKGKLKLLYNIHFITFTICKYIKLVVDLNLKGVKIWVK